jgi:hypothetical protein
VTALTMIPYIGGFHKRQRWRPYSANRPSLGISKENMSGIVERHPMIGPKILVDSTYNFAPIQLKCQIFISHYERKCRTDYSL